MKYKSSQSEVQNLSKLYLLLACISMVASVSPLAEEVPNCFLRLGLPVGCLLHLSMQEKVQNSSASEISGLGFAHIRPASLTVCKKQRGL